MITKKYYKLVKVSYEDSGYFYVKNVSDQTGTLTMKNGGNVNKSIEYSTDGVNWIGTTYNTPFSLAVQGGGAVYMRSGTMSNADIDSLQIFMDVPHITGGNILSLLNKSNFETRTNIGGQINVFRQVFKNDTNLIDASALNFGLLDTIRTEFFKEMFYGCTSLKNGPDMTFATMGTSCFNSMFYGCSALTSVKIGITNWNTSNATDWLKNVSASGTIYAPTGSDIANYSGANGVPSGWTVVYY